MKLLILYSLTYSCFCSNGTYGSFKWAPFTNSAQSYMDIHNLQPGMNTRHERRVLGFWEEYIPALDASMIKAKKEPSTSRQVQNMQDTAQAYQIGMWVMVAVTLLLFIACCIMGLVLCRGYVMKYNMNGQEDSIYSKPMTLSMDSVVSYS